jgi:DNA-binding CsgD family transcriptional regulator
MNLTVRLIPADASGVVVFDLGTGAPEDSILHNLDPDLDRRYREHYYAKDPCTHRALAMGLHVFRPTDVLEQTEWERSEYYTDLMLAHGYAHFLVSNCTSGSELSILMALCRKVDGCPFSDRDVEILRLLEPHFTKALRQAKQFDEIRSLKDSFVASFNQIPLPMFAFNHAGGLKNTNCAAQNLCAALTGDPKCIPEQIADFASDTIIRCCHGTVTDNPVRDITAEINDQEYRLTAYSVCPSGTPGYNLIVVHRIMSHEDILRYRVMEAYSLSPREADIFIMVAEGMTNHEIAEKVFLSEYTVKDHLKSVFRKLEVSSRSKAVAKLLCT